VLQMCHKDELVELGISSANIIKLLKYQLLVKYNIKQHAELTITHSLF